MSDLPLLSGPELTNEFVITLPQTCAIEGARVPNEFPPYQTKHKIAVVGEAPGKDEVREGRPFIGASGNLLFGRLRSYGINRADCLVANVSQHMLDDSEEEETSEKRKYKKNKAWYTKAVQEGLEILRSDIKQHDPNCILLLGNLALKAAFPREDRSIKEWRGSILKVTDENSPFYGYKVISTIHPAAVFREWDQFPLFTFDCARFAQEAQTAEYNLPNRVFQLNVPPHLAIEYLRAITDVPTPVALDIEGGTYGMSCVSFAGSPHGAFIIPLSTYSDRDKVPVLRELNRFLASTTPKVLQNQLYDNFVLSWTYRSPIRNVIWDTMLSGWEIYPELPKGLGTQVSIWTREPYYKFERKSNSTQTLHEYCCKDSACTHEIFEAHRRYFQSTPAAYHHFRFNMAMLPALLYMQLRGMHYDKVLATELSTGTYTTLADIERKINKNIEDIWIKHGRRGDKPDPLNVRSPKQVAECLYVRFGYPKQHPKKGREVDKTKVTTDADALLNLKKTYNGPSDAILENILQHRHYDGIRETLELATDKDGRMRCSYNLVGTETGRLGCSKSATGSGANLTTITKKLRTLYCADDDHWFFQCDLSGADGWTVAAHCALRGDSTMLDDYNFGLKPAKIIVLMLRHGKQVNTWSRERLREESKSIKEDSKETGMIYFAAKRVQHGTNYGLGTARMSDQILKDSYKLTGESLLVSKHECQQLQDLYLYRYPGIPLWHRWVQNQINETSTLPCASGHTRKFFGRARDHATFREAYAHEPQANTTYATNLALFRLWNDPDNRRHSVAKILEVPREPNHHPLGLTLSLQDIRRDIKNRSFIVEPLHHVHDALCGQFHKRDLEWAREHIRKWFNNPITIAGRQIVIPFGGAYGPNWYQLGPEGPKGEKWPGGTI